MVSNAAAVISSIDMKTTQFRLNEGIEILRNTPAVLAALLEGVSENWTNSKGDLNDWMPFDVVGHLVHGERTDWIPRAEIILRQDDERTFTPYDRIAQFDESKGKTIKELLDEFAKIRRQNLELLISWNLTEDQLDLEGIHPELGPVKLRQLLSTWAAHDLGHIRQIVTAMAGRYKDEVGPWRQYLSILN